MVYNYHTIKLETFIKNIKYIFSINMQTKVYSTHILEFSPN